MSPNDSGTFRLRPSSPAIGVSSALDVSTRDYSVDTKRNTLGERLSEACATQKICGRHALGSENRFGSLRAQIDDQRIGNPAQTPARGDPVYLRLRAASVGSCGNRGGIGPALDLPPAAGNSSGQTSLSSPRSSSPGSPGRQTDSLTPQAAGQGSHLQLPAAKPCPAPPHRPPQPLRARHRCGCAR